MEYSGHIILYDSNHNPVSIRKYNGRWNRSFIIAEWAKRYAKAFYNCYFVISPHVDDDSVNLSNYKPKRHKYEAKSIYNTNNSHYEY